MNNKIVPKSEQFDCQKCNRAVTFRFNLREFSADEIEVVERILDTITYHGKCQIAENANIPNHPVYSEMQACPVYQELTKRNW